MLTFLFTASSSSLSSSFAGGEYFFSSSFSVGIEAQLNLTFSDKNSVRFANPGGTNLNTGSVIYASIYF